MHLPSTHCAPGLSHGLETHRLTASFLWGEIQVLLLEEEMGNHSSILAWRIHGQRSLVGYSPWGHKESDTTEQLIPTKEIQRTRASSCLTLQSRTPLQAPGLVPTRPLLCHVTYLPFTYHLFQAQPGCNSVRGSVPIYSQGIKSPTGVTWAHRSLPPNEFMILKTHA